MNSIRQLLNHQAPEKRTVARSILAQQIGTELNFIFVNPDYELTSCQAKEFSQKMNLLDAGCPKQYLTQTSYFVNFKFKVSNSVLCPRPETETLLQWAVTNAHPNSQILELGTGSGCLGIALAKLRADCQIYATDISHDAAKIAKENAMVHDVSNNYHLAISDWGAALNSQCFDLVISNPPYVESTHLQTSAQLQYEPQLALDGGEDGLAEYRKLIPQLADLLAADGMIALEHGANQAQHITALLIKYGFVKIQTEQDQFSRERITIAQRK